MIDYPTLTHIYKTLANNPKGVMFKFILEESEKSLYIYRSKGKRFDFDLEIYDGGWHKIGCNPGEIGEWLLFIEDKHKVKILDIKQERYQDGSG